MLQMKLGMKEENKKKQEQEESSTTIIPSPHSLTVSTPWLAIHSCFKALDHQVTGSTRTSNQGFLEQIPKESYDPQVPMKSKGFVYNKSEVKTNEMRNIRFKQGSKTQAESVKFHIEQAFRRRECGKERKKRCACEIKGQLQMFYRVAGAMKQSEVLQVLSTYTF